MAAIDPVELRTPRLLLRPLAQDDAASLLRIHADPRVMRYSSIPCWAGAQQAHELIAASHKWASAGRALCFGIALKDAVGVIGTCTLFGIERGSRRAEVGFALGLDAWGRGYMTEALKAVLAYGFRELDLNRVEAEVDPRNAAAVTLLDRLGFLREGLLRERRITEGEKSDAALYGLLRSDWFRLAAVAPTALG
jgi:ribosomal-protein-alanine N-acetyltransferase